jgi:hypothetical protein
VSPRPDVSARALALFRRRPSRTAAVGVLVVWGGVGAWLAADFSGRIRDWSVMTDEMLYAKLAISIADSGSPLPRVHGVLVGVVNQLYPLLLAPFFGGFTVPSAFHAAHVFNAPLMASAAIPAYLLARQVVPRAWSLAVSVLSVTVPWMVLTGVLMTESVAYPAFLWAMLACLATIRRPSPRSDLLAIAGLVLAVLARTQFVALAVVLPVAVLTDALACADGRGLRRRLADGLTTALKRHPVLAGGYVSAAALAAGLAAFFSLGNALGVYSTTLHGSILPSSVWPAAAAHLDAVAIGCGLVPLLLGGGWMLAATARPRHRASFPFAILGVLTIAALTLETASFDARFGGTEIVRDRYLFYIVPLLLIGTAAALADARRRGVALSAAALTVFFAATIHLLPFPTSPGFWVDSPARILNSALADASGSLGTATFVALAGACLGLAAVLGFLLLPGRVVGAVVLAFLLPFTVLTTQKEIDSVAAGKSSSGRPVTGPPGVVLDWVDSVLPAGARAAMIPFPQSPEFALDAVFWWDIEFWNRSVGQTFVATDKEFSYAPFPNQTLTPNWSSGLVPGTASAPTYVVFALNDPRYRLTGIRHAENIGLQVIVADRPYRAQWATRGLDTDGWAPAGKPITIRIYSQSSQAQLARLAITLGAPQQAPVRYLLRARGTQQRGQVAAAALQTPTLDACIPAHSFTDILLTSSSDARIPKAPSGFDVTGTRRVGARVGPLTATFTHRPCAN